MNRHALTGFIAALLLALGSLAANSQTPREGSEDPGPAANTTAPATTAPGRAGGEVEGTSYKGMKDGASWERVHRASKIIGTDVINRQGEKIGDIEDIVLDGKGTIAYAVVSTGGFLGIADRLHAVPWQSLQTQTGRSAFILDIDKERLKNAPGFDKKNWPNLSDEKWSSENSRHFPREHPTGSAPRAAGSAANTQPASK
jgi:sporulation protein YlmC with PRC-barrel domain